MGSHEPAPPRKNRTEVFLEPASFDKFPGFLQKNITILRTDAGTMALYELGLLKISLWRQQDESNTELKKKFLEEARATLTSFISSYPDNFCAEQVKKNLEDLPTN